MNRIEKILTEYGPMLSGELAVLLEKNFSVSNDAARQAISRARSPIQKVSAFPFSKNQVFCYLEKQYNSPTYRRNLYAALKNEAAAVSRIIKALENSNYIMKKEMLSVFSKSPIEKTKGHRGFERIVSDLCEQGILYSPTEGYYALSPQFSGEDFNLASSKSGEEITKIVVTDFALWASKLNLVAFNSVRAFPEEAIFAHFKWMVTAPSYIDPLFDYKKKRPGFLVADAVLKYQATVEDIAFFVEKVNIIRNFKGIPTFAPVILVNKVTPEALRYLKENKVVVGILSNLFDKKYAETIMNIYNVLCDATRVLLKEPQQIENLLAWIKKSEGRFNNAMGALFECVVGRFFYRLGCKSIELNKLVLTESGRYEIDVFAERDGKLYIIECKATRTKVDAKYVEKWLSSRVHAFQKTFSDKKIVFSIWSLGGFDSAADELLRKQRESVRRYELSYLDKAGICEFATKHNDRELCRQINEYYFDYGNL